MGMTCSKICNECPFSNKSMAGYLAAYEPQDIVNMMSGEVAFICHLQVNENTTFEDAEISVINGDKKICRGYIESIIKSCISPKYSQVLKDCIDEVKASGLSEETMSKWNFVKHHTNG